MNSKLHLTIKIDFNVSIKSLERSLIQILFTFAKSRSARDEVPGKQSAHSIMMENFSNEICDFSMCVEISTHLSFIHTFFVLQSAILFS